MTTTQFIFAVLALLLTPGPTNTLLALAGASVGLRRALALIPAEIAGYLVTTVPLTLAGARLLAEWPEAAIAVKLVAGGWVMLLAVRLWRSAPLGTMGALVTARRVFVTTLLNPKALVFGLVLLPAPGVNGAAAPMLVRFGLFVATIIAVATLWAAAGGLFRRDPVAPEPPVLLRQISAAWLAVLALGLATDAMAAVIRLS